ncbi:hypothetical protein CPC08DRAFT_717825 [Agrocybe pediades]|nr:hypothetical protein CPC08DRAFT_717825 [Agrocybe pediades]
MSPCAISLCLTQSRTSHDCVEMDLVLIAKPCPSTSTSTNYTERGTNAAPTSDDPDGT